MDGREDTRMRDRLRSILLSAAIGVCASSGVLATNPAYAAVNLATGLDSSGNLQYAGNSLDANWQVTGAVNPISPPNAYVVGDDSADSGFPLWPPNGPNSSWIAANPDDPRGNGLMTFTRSFVVSDPSTAAIVGGSWAIDDLGALTLNGNILAFLGAGRDPAYALYPFTTVPSNFVVGVNTLTIEITATDYWVEGARLQGVLTEGITAVPEPSTWAAMLAGFAGLGFVVYHQRRRNAPLPQSRKVAEASRSRELRRPPAPASPSARSGGRSRTPGRRGSSCRSAVPRRRGR